MAGVDFIISLEAAQPLEREHLVQRDAAVEIDAAAAASEERVAGEEGALAADRHAARRMAGRSDDLKTHPCLVPYEELPEEEKEYDRKTSIGTLKLIIKL